MSSPSQAQQPTAPSKPRKTKHGGWLELPKHLTLGLLVLLTLFPIYYIIVNSFKTVTELATSNLNLPSHLEWNNYGLAWTALQLPLLNTSLIVGAGVLGIVALAALSAYAFARIEFPGRNALFVLVFALLLVPGFLTLIPLFLQIKKMNLSGGHLSLILPYIAGGQAFSIFVLKSFFETLPKELFEAAKVDGANDFQMFSRIALPLSVPILVTVALINLVPLWNDLLLPRLVLNEQSKTVTLALLSFTGVPMGQIGNDAAINAGYVLASLPLVIVMGFLMRYYIEGLTSGSVKA